MKSISLLPFVIFSVFVVTSESKKFCNAFEDNANGIDYIFEFSYYNRYQWMARVVFIIGYDYWLIDDNDTDFLRFESNDSAVSDVFGDHYSTVFSVYRSYPKSFEYAFLRKNDSFIEWKAMDNSLNFNSTTNKVLKTTSIDLPKEIQSINNRRLLTFILELLDSRTEVRVFVGQKQNPNSGMTRFERTYLYFHFKNGSEGMPQKITNQSSVVNHSKGDNNVIGVSGAINYKQSASILVFFQRNQIIEYCFHNTTELLNYSLESPCFTERKVLIDCSTDSTEMQTNSTLISTPIPKKEVNWLILLPLALVVAICILTALCCCYGCTHGFRYFGSEPSAQNIDDYNSQRSKKSGQSSLVLKT